MRHVDKIGDYPEIKSRSLSKSLFNFYAVVALCVIVIIRYLTLIEADGFAVLLTRVPGGSGFKFTKELKSGGDKPESLPSSDEG